MKARIWGTGAIVLCVLALGAVLGTAQAPVVPKGIIPTPPDSELEVRIWVDKAAYQLGEPITIKYSVSRPAYIYIWDIQPDGIANPLFPYPSSTSPNNYVQAGEHTLPPPPGYGPRWTIGPPTGTEYLQILATTTPVQPFAQMSGDPAAFQQSIEVQILGILPVEQRSWNFTSFEIVSGTPTSYGLLTVNSTPSGATISIDGTYVGYTPRTLYVPQGFHRVAVSKPGYTTWTASVFTIGGLTRTINAQLERTTPANSPPTARFTYSPQNPSIGEWVAFDATASFDPDGTIVSYAWNFGNGATGNRSTDWQRYAAGGSYTVTLTVTDNSGASNVTSQTVRVGPVNQPPVATFSFTPPNPIVQGWVKFDASASADPDGTIVSYAWDFGDGKSGSNTVAWNAYSAPGTYVATLTVRDGAGATNSTTRTVQVGTSNLPPMASFTFSPPTPRVGEWVQFNASASTDPDGSIVSYSWSFGDGKSGTDVVAWNQFATAGTYTVTLAVRDDDGSTHSTSKTVIVGTTAQPPVASFTYSPSTPTVGQPILLNAQSSYDPDGTIVSYLWDLDGNGSTDLTGTVAQVTYATAGTVLVRLTVVDNDGLSASTTQPILVSSGGGVWPGTQPPMGSTPGFFVWGTDSWHVTVNGASTWTTPHNYRIELRTDGTFQNVGQTASELPSSASAAPMGIIPTPTEGGKTLVYEGSVRAGNIDHTFRVPNSESIWLSLQLDIDGDGDLDTSPSFVYLRYSMVHPPTSPFVVGLPGGSSAELTPSLDFRIGNAVTVGGTVMYTATSHFVYWTTTISALERP